MLGYKALPMKDAAGWGRSTKRKTLDIVATTASRIKPKNKEISTNPKQFYLAFVTILNCAVHNPYSLPKCAHEKTDTENKQ